MNLVNQNEAKEPVLLWNFFGKKKKSNKPKKDLFSGFKFPSEKCKEKGDGYVWSVYNGTSNCINLKKKCESHKRLKSKWHEKNSRQARNARDFWGDFVRGEQCQYMQPYGQKNKYNNWRQPYQWVVDDDQTKDQLLKTCQANYDDDCK
tara:strand:- start:319 stop:762 length:444 start_codon:yes stop_codon:yes gene_type:complete